MKNLYSYCIGFVASIILTLLAYGVVTSMSLSGSVTLVIILAVAVLQVFVQLIFFLHLSQKPKDRLNIVALCMAVSIILLVVLGSIWIMDHLNYNMTPKQMENYVQSQDGF